MTDAPPRALLRSDWAVTAALSVGIFVVHARGACRVAYVGDSGELLAAVHLLGIPHPTSYPLYVLLGKLWTVLLPLGSVALRMSLFSAACAMLTCATLHRTCRAQGLGAWPAALAPLVLAFSPSFWSQANVQRVYSLNALFVVLAMTLAWRWWRDREDRHLVLAALACGLGASNHTAMAVVAFAIGIFAVVVEPRVLLRVRTIAGTAVAFAVGLLPYAYLPLRSRSDPPLDWGDPETLDRFLTVVFRRNFWDRSWVQGPGDALVVLGDYLASYVVELTLLGLPLALWGAAAVARAHGRLVVLPLAVMATNVLSVGLHGSYQDIFVWHRYYLPSYIMAAWLVAHGWQEACRRLQRWAQPGALLVPLVLLILGWQSFDRSRHRFSDDYGRQLLESLPPGSHLVASDDNILFGLIYLHLVEDVRPDVDLILQGVGEAALPPLRFEPNAVPVFFTHHPNWSLAGLDVLPWGFAYRPWRTGQPMPAAPLLTLDGADDPSIPKDYLTQSLIGHSHYMAAMTASLQDWPSARAFLEKAAAAAPRDPVLQYNLGIVYERFGLLEEAMQRFATSHRLYPRRLPTSRSAPAGERRKLLEREVERLAPIVERLEKAELASRPFASVSDRHLRLAAALRSAGEERAAIAHGLLAEEAAR